MNSDKIVHVAYDKVLNSYIPFASASDALLANVALRIDASDVTDAVISVFDALVGAVCCPAFDGNEVTVTQFSDILLGVGKARAKALQVTERRAVADAGQRRGHQQHFLSDADQALPEYDFAGMPFMVFRLTLDHLSDLVDIFVDEKGGKENIRFDNDSTVDIISLQNVLSKMNVVHPSWTMHVSNVLGRYVEVTSAPGRNFISALLRSPAIGEWTRHLVMVDDFFPWGTPLQSALFRRISGIRSFGFRFPHKSDLDISFVTAMIVSLCGLRSLECIRIVFDEDLSENDSEVAMAFCQLLSEAKALPPIKFVHIVFEGSFGPRTTLSPTLAPFTSIKSVSNIRVTNEYFDDGQLFTEILWTRQHSETTLESDATAFLATSGTVDEVAYLSKVKTRELLCKETESARISMMMLSQLHSVRLHMQDNFSGYQYNDFTREASSARDVTVIVVLGGGTTLPRFMMEIPSSTEVLTVSLEFSGCYFSPRLVSSLKTWISDVCALITSDKCPSHFRELRIFASGLNKHTGDLRDATEAKALLKECLADCAGLFETRKGARDVNFELGIIAS